MAKTFTDQNFQAEVIHATVPVLVDFWAPWCGPCRMQGPVVDEVAQELEGKPVSIGKMNTDENPTTPNQFGIQSIPTLLIFKNGKVVDQMVGVQDKNTLLAKLAAAMQ